jgi:hypothetical protein
MDYDAVAAYFLVPTSDQPIAPTLPQSPARRLRDAIEPIATIGWWSREASSALSTLGHDFFDGYVWGRAAVLGADVSPAVVAAAFGWFEPAMLGAVYTLGRGVSSCHEVLSARSAGASAGLAAATTNVDVAAVGWLGERLLDALDGLDGVGRPLFAGLREQAAPASVHGKAWRAAELVREHRGDGHIAVVAASAFDVVEMNVLTEVWLDYPIGEYSASRAFSGERVEAAAARLRSLGLLDDSGRLTPEGRSGRDQIEAATDEAQVKLVDALGEDLDRVVAVANLIGDAVLAAHAAPADPRKRAAG